jgi:hypothetical protein
MGWNPFKKKSWTDVGKAIEDTANDAAHTVADTATNVGNTIADTATDVANTVANGVTDAANQTADFVTGLVNDTTKAVEHTANTCAAQASDYAKQGFDVASNEWKQGTQAACNAVSHGVEAIEWAATEAYEWLDANACYVGLNLALTTGCVMYFTPKPDPAEPGTVTSTAISATYLGYIVSKGTNAAMATAVGHLITESIWLIPGVKGNCNKQTLNNVIVNVIATCNPAVLSVSLATPAGVGIFIGSVISPIVAQLVCEKIAPKGFTKAVS